MEWAAIALVVVGLACLLIGRTLDRRAKGDMADLVVNGDRRRDVEERLTELEHPHES